MQRNLLSVRQLTKQYNEQAGVSGLSFDVKEGEFLSILGPSGGGKSTLLQLIAGLIKPDSGEIYIDGVAVYSKHKQVDPQQRGINMVFQNYALWPHMTVYEHMNFGFKNQKLNTKQRQLKIDQLIALLELEGLEKRLPAELSGGQQQRVAIARALSTNPRILLLDEPMSNLDGFLRLQMRSQLKVLFQQLGTTVLYVTHDPVEAMAMADKLLIIKDGQIEQYDTPQDCYQAPATPWVAGLLGAINRITTRVTVDKERVFYLGSETLHSQNPFPDKSYPVGKLVELRSRPEDIFFHREEPDVPSSYNINHPTVIYSGFEGKHWRLTLRNDEGGFLYYGLHHSYVEPGTKIWVTSEICKLFAYPIDKD